VFTLFAGDRVKYVGPSKKADAKHRPLSSGQRGEVYEVNGNRVAVIFDIGGDTSSEGGDKKSTEHSHKLHMHWIDVGDLKHDLDMQAEDGYIALEALSEVCVEVTLCFRVSIQLTLYIGLIYKFRSDHLSSSSKCS
jgi:hypothetical protein